MPPTILSDFRVRSLETMPCWRRSANEGREAAKLKIATVNEPHQLGLGFVDPDLAVLGIVAERHHPADPQTLALGGRDLVANALGSDLAFELGEREKDIEREPAHGRGGIELLGDRYERDIMLVEQLDKLGKVCQRPGQPVDLIDHDHIDLAGPYVTKKLLQSWAVGIAAGKSPVIVLASDQGPAGMRLAADVGLRSIVLGIQRIEVLFEALVIRHAGVDSAANAFWGEGCHCVRPFAGLSRNPKNLGSF